MSTNQQTLLRQWHMLRMVPRYPQKVTAQQIASRLKSEEFDVHERTIQRDLNELSEVFPLTADSRDKPFGWSWQKDAPSFDLPGLGIEEALTLLLVEQHLQDFLPPATLDHLKPSFLAATSAINNVCRDAKAKAWLDKIRAVPPVQRLTPPSLVDGVQKAVYEALLRDLQLNLVYRKRGQSQIIHYTVHPLAVVQRGPVLYLVCTFSDYPDVRLLALHRILSAEISAAAVRRPKGFSIDKVIASGIMGFGGEKTIQLEAIFERERAEHLRDTPLNDTQALTDVGSDHVQLTATVIDTSELRWWLTALGPVVEVIGPPELRQAMADAAIKTAAKYAR